MLHQRTHFSANVVGNGTKELFTNCVTFYGHIPGLKFACSGQSGRHFFMLLSNVTKCLHQYLTNTGEKRISLFLLLSCSTDVKKRSRRRRTRYDLKFDVLQTDRCAHSGEIGCTVFRPSRDTPTSTDTMSSGDVTPSDDARSLGDGSSSTSSSTSETSSAECSPQPPPRIISVAKLSRRISQPTKRSSVVTVFGVFGRLQRY
eukprot:TRINITY_DN15267_c0_g1_i1.p1 TRINITY_DN15267_c0_g1~~TRINITY_DN15267_c0_g1_i1.p1  ORF type:complete len:202 (-),score=10.86 TRINITY_DN15267_c0_g1_i1:389-994(-)